MVSVDVRGPQSIVFAMSSGCAGVFVHTLSKTQIDNCSDLAWRLYSENMFYFAKQSISLAANFRDCRRNKNES